MSVGPPMAATMLLSLIDPEAEEVIALRAAAEGVPPEATCPMPEPAPAAEKEASALPKEAEDADGPPCSSPEEIAGVLGLNAEDRFDAVLFAILQPLLERPVPMPWKACGKSDGSTVFFHPGLQVWRRKHPLLSFFGQLLRILRKLAATGESMTDALGREIVKEASADKVQRLFGLWSSLPQGGYTLLDEPEGDDYAGRMERVDDPRLEATAGIAERIHCWRHLWAGFAPEEPFPFVEDRIESLAVQLADNVVLVQGAAGGFVEQAMEVPPVYAMTKEERRLQPLVSSILGKAYGVALDVVGKSEWNVIVPTPAAEAAECAEESLALSGASEEAMRGEQLPTPKATKGRPNPGGHAEEDDDDEDEYSEDEYEDEYEDEFNSDEDQDEHENEESGDEGSEEPESEDEISSSALTKDENEVTTEIHGPVRRPFDPTNRKPLQVRTNFEIKFEKRENERPAFSLDEIKPFAGLGGSEAANSWAEENLRPPSPEHKEDDAFAKRPFTPGRPFTPSQRGRRGFNAKIWSEEEAVRTYVVKPYLSDLGWRCSKNILVNRIQAVDPAAYEGDEHFGSGTLQLGTLRSEGDTCCPHDGASSAEPTKPNTARGGGGCASLGCGRSSFLQPSVQTSAVPTVSPSPVGSARLPMGISSKKTLLETAPTPGQMSTALPSQTVTAPGSRPTTASSSFATPRSGITEGKMARLLSPRSLHVSRTSRRAQVNSFTMMLAASGSAFDRAVNREASRPCTPAWTFANGEEDLLMLKSRERPVTSRPVLKRADMPTRMPGESVDLVEDTVEGGMGLPPTPARGRVPAPHYMEGAEKPAGYVEHVEPGRRPSSADSRCPHQSRKLERLRGDRPDSADGRTRRPCDELLPPRASVTSDFAGQAVRRFLTRRFGTMQKAFQALDTKGKGMVSFTDFEARMRELGFTEDHSLREAFDAIDRSQHHVLLYNDLADRRGIDVREGIPPGVCEAIGGDLFSEVVDDMIGPVISEVFREILLEELMAPKGPPDFRSTELSSAFRITGVPPLDDCDLSSDSGVSDAGGTKTSFLNVPGSRTRGSSRAGSQSYRSGLCSRGTLRSGHSGSARPSSRGSQGLLSEISSSAASTKPRKVVRKRGLLASAVAKAAETEEGAKELEEDMRWTEEAERILKESNAQHTTKAQPSFDAEWLRDLLGPASAAAAQVKEKPSKSPKPKRIAERPRGQLGARTETMSEDARSSDGFSSQRLGAPNRLGPIVGAPTLRKAQAKFSGYGFVEPKDPGTRGAQRSRSQAMPRGCEDICKTYGHIFKLLKDPLKDNSKKPAKRSVQVAVPGVDMSQSRINGGDGDDFAEEAEMDPLTPTVQLPPLGSSQSLPTLSASGKADLGTEGAGAIRFPPLSKKQLSKSGKDKLSRSMSTGIDGACRPGMHLSSPVR